MITVHIRKQGGAAVITIPANVLKLLELDIGAELALDVTKQGLVAKPVHTYQRKRYSLKELLHGATRKNLKALNAMTEWARSGKATGREIE